LLKLGKSSAVAVAILCMVVTAIAVLGSVDFQCISQGEGLAKTSPSGSTVAQINSRRCLNPSLSGTFILLLPIFSQDNEGISFSLGKFGESKIDSDIDSDYSLVWETDEAIVVHHPATTKSDRVPHQLGNSSIWIKYAGQ
jgi:hypothetical protein